MRGIQIKYAELLRLSVEQLFYQNKICRQYKTGPDLDILIVPTENCLNVIRRMDLIFRNTDTNGGFVLLARVSGQNAAGNNILRFPADKEDVLSFLMILKNRDIINFNDLPIQPAKDRVYYFNNEISDASAPRNDLHLTKDPLGVNGLNDSIKKSSENYRFYHSGAVVPGTAIVKNMLTGEAVGPKSQVNHAGQCDLVFDLSTLTSGKCQLLINNMLKDEFYYLPTSSGQLIFGIIDLSLSSSLEANYRVTELDRSLTQERPRYVIRFINRQTRWRYTIQLQTNSPLYLEISDLSPAEKADFLNRLNIVAINDAAITFSKIAATDTEFIFESDNPLPLREKYFSSGSVTSDALNLTLRKYIGDIKEKNVKTYLPYPQTGSIDASAFPQIHSDIFLTL